MSFKKNRLKKRAQKKLAKRKKRNELARFRKHAFRSKNKLQRARIRRRRASKTIKYIECFPPAEFSFLQNTNRTSDFIREVADLYNQQKPIFVKLEHIEYIDYSAIAVLISIMASFREKNIPFEGSFPENEICRDTLLNAGFFRELARKNMRWY